VYLGTIAVHFGPAAANCKRWQMIFVSRLHLCFLLLVNHGHDYILVHTASMTAANVTARGPQGSDAINNSQEELYRSGTQ